MPKNDGDVIIDKRLEVYNLDSADGMLMKDVKITGTVPDMSIYEGVESLEEYKSRIYDYPR